MERSPNNVAGTMRVRIEQRIRVCSVTLSTGTGNGSVLRVRVGNAIAADLYWPPAVIWSALEK